LYHHFGDVAFSFFPPYVCNAVKSQDWNEKEDCPILAGEEALDKVLKPYMEDSRMNMMFDFHNIQASEVRNDIQHQSLHPKKNGKPNDCPPDDMQLATATKPPPAAQVSVGQQKQAHCDALSVGCSKAQSAYCHHDGHPRESSNRQEVHWGANLMLQTGALDDNLSIQTDEHKGTQYLKDD
jgi:predicted CxxxxCH...CXXCH cytochrome family protein